MVRRQDPLPVPLLPLQENYSGWTVETYAVHNEALRAADLRFQEERDRRYTEVGVEREKALKIKETADLAALGLAREIQTYKDEKANELREQINSERSLYVTRNDLGGVVEKFEATIKPLSEYVTSQQGRDKGSTTTWAIVVVLVTVILGALGLAATVLIFILNNANKVAPV